MPAKTFFSMLELGLKKHVLDRAYMIMDLIDVGQCAQADREWINELKNHHRSRINKLSGVEELPANTTKFRTPEELTVAAKIMMEGMKRISGHV
jgi:hypothetical protein